MDKEKDIDNIFKKGLGNPAGDHEHMDADWDAMEQMLDSRKKRPFVIYWLPILSGVAAVLLLVIGWWLLKPAATHQQNNRLVIVHHNSNPGITKVPSSPASNIAPDFLAQHAANTVNRELAVTSNTAPNTHRASGGRNQPGISSSGKTNENVPVVHNIEIEKNRDNAELLAYNPAPFNVPNSQLSDREINAVNLNPPSLISGPIVDPVITKGKKIAYAYRPQLALSVLASSDKNGINSFQQSKPGDNAGVLFSFGVSRKLTISTGAIYSAKQYLTDFADYHTDYKFPTNPESVLADCKMFDIPINVDYQVFNKHRNKITVGTGFSSYLMLNENYQFNYAGNSIGPTKYGVSNPDKYLFSIVNIQATYERQINSKVGITLEPYMKLPISGVGSSEVRLQSTGVAVGLKWNLNSVRP